MLNEDTMEGKKFRVRRTISDALKAPKITDIRDDEDLCTVEITRALPSILKKGKGKKGAGNRRLTADVKRSPRKNNDTKAGNKSRTNESSLRLTTNMMKSLKGKHTNESKLNKKTVESGEKPGRVKRKGGKRTNVRQKGLEMRRIDTNVNKEIELKTMNLPSLEKLAKEDKKGLNIVKGSNKAQINLDQVKEAVCALLQVHKKEIDEKSEIFDDDEEQPVSMQVVCIKIPVGRQTILRTKIPHRLVSDTSDVCLFVKDLPRRRRKVGPTIQYYENLLCRRGVTAVTRIIPMRQLETEYSHPEAKRNLYNQFDVFLADKFIASRLYGVLGKEFRTRRKVPFILDLAKQNLKREVRKALSKTFLRLKSKGDSSYVQVGHTKQSPENIAENILAVIEGLKKHYPGGFENIRSLLLKTDASVSIPIYMNLKSANSVEVPKLFKPRQPPVEGELSTINDRKVIVYPNGTVKVLPKESEKQQKTRRATASQLAGGKMLTAQNDTVDPETTENSEDRTDDNDNSTSDSKFDSMFTDGAKQEPSNSNDDEDAYGMNEGTSDSDSDSDDEDILKKAEKSYLKFLGGGWKTSGQEAKKRKSTSKGGGTKTKKLRGKENIKGKSGGKSATPGSWSVTPSGT